MVALASVTAAAVMMLMFLSQLTFFIPVRSGSWDYKSDACLRSLSLSPASNQSEVSEEKTFLFEGHFVLKTNTSLVEADEVLLTFFYYLLIGAVCLNVFLLSSSSSSVANAFASFLDEDQCIPLPCRSIWLGLLSSSTSLPMGIITFIPFLCSPRWIIGPLSFLFVFATKNFRFPMHHPTQQRTGAVRATYDERTPLLNYLTCRLSLGAIHRWTYWVLHKST